MAITWTDGLEPIKDSQPSSYRSIAESTRRSVNYLQGVVGTTNPLETYITFLTGIYSVNLINGGSDYLNAPTVAVHSLGSSGGSGATVTSTISSGVVNVLTLTNTGSGYLKIPTGASQTLTSPSVSITGVDIITTFIDDDIDMSTNVITKTSHNMSNGDRVHLTTDNRLPYGLYETDDIGNIYTNPDFYVIDATTNTFKFSKTSGGSSVNIKSRFATATGIIATNVPEGQPASNYLVGVNITDGGMAYTTIPTVTISAPPSGGTQATATAIIKNGFVDEIEIVNGGSGYIEIPTITFAGGLGTHSIRNGGGAIATTTIGHGATAKPITSDTGVVTGITMLTSGGGTGATATASNVGDSVASTSGLSGGSGYSSAPTISFTGGDGTGAAATATESGGAITGITITSGGSGYTSAPTMVFSGGGGTGASATAVLEIHTYLTSVTLTAGGSGYETVPTVTFSDPSSGTTATGTATVTNGAVTAITLTNAGSGYSTLPSFVFFGGGSYVNATVDIKSGGNNATSTGSGATATCTLEAAAVKTSTVTAGGTSYASLRSLSDKATGVITDPISTDKAVAVSESAQMATWMINNGGSGYTSAPTVSFSGGGGSGAAGTASVSGGTVTSVSITSGGSSYSSAPSISYSGGGGSGASGTVILSGGAVSSVQISNLPSAWASAGYSAADIGTVKAVVDIFITKCTEAENAIASLLAQISVSTVGNFLEHNEMQCGLQDTRIDPYKKAFHDLMGDALVIENVKDAAGVPYVNYYHKLFGTLLKGNDAINTCMTHLYVNPLSAGTYDALNIQAAINAASSNATTLAANVTAVKAPLEVWVSNVSGDVGAFNTLRTADETESATVDAFLNYWLNGQKYIGYWGQDYTKFMYTDVVGSTIGSEILTDKDSNNIT